MRDTQQDNGATPMKRQQRSRLMLRDEGRQITEDRLAVIGRVDMGIDAEHARQY